MFLVRNFNTLGNSLFRTFPSRLQATSFKTGFPAFFSNTPNLNFNKSNKLEFKNTSVNLAAVKTPYNGSFHWNAERALSLVSLPLVGSAFIYGSIPLVDIGLAIVLPLHTHMGFESCITDYVPKRVYGVLNTILSWILKVSTVLTLYGCYVINSQDVGMTALAKRLWTGKL
ncbi:membrane anchor subunit of succinate dehydrogenase, Sdh4 [Globomyces sp. JEL0801]|nr:membrane anchor subunit of succinate dehydrogenase, Sdh4 [Globomyces sp. JEL0801]